MIVITPTKMQSDECMLEDRVSQLNKFLGREAYRLEKVGEKYKLLAVKTISNGEVLSCLVIVPAVSATYMLEIVNELWHMLHRKAV